MLLGIRIKKISKRKLIKTLRTRLVLERRMNNDVEFERAITYHPSLYEHFCVRQATVELDIFVK